MRLPGWETRLVQVIEDARSRPYVLGVHDCFRLACRVVEALTGVDRWPAFAGYSTTRECIARLSLHGASSEAVGDWLFGDRIERNFARRGDIAALRIARDQLGALSPLRKVPAIRLPGVVMGSSVFALRHEGLVALPLTAAHCCWRIG